MEGISDLLMSMEADLQSEGMRTHQCVNLGNDTVADLAAYRLRFSWKGLVLLSQHALVRSVESATPSDLREFFDRSFAYARRTNRVPLLRGMQFGYVIIPCLLVQRANSDLIRIAENCPPRHWSINELPVVVDLQSRTAHYFRETALWGSFYFSDMRELVENGICRAVDAA